MAIVIMTGANKEGRGYHGGWMHPWQAGLHHTSPHFICQFKHLQTLRFLQSYKFTASHTAICDRDLINVGTTSTLINVDCLIITSTEL